MEIWFLNIFVFIFDHKLSFVSEYWIFKYKYWNFEFLNIFIFALLWKELLFYCFCPIMHIYQFFYGLFSFWSILSNTILGLWAEKLCDSLQFWPPRIIIGIAIKSSSIAEPRVVSWSPWHKGQLGTWHFLSNWHWLILATSG